MYQFANPVATPLKDTAYIVIAKTNAGCIDRDTVFIKVKNLNEVYVPTAFSPNNDGRNDVWKVRAKDQQKKIIEKKGTVVLIR